MLGKNGISFCEDMDSDNILLIKMGFDNIHEDFEHLISEYYGFISPELIKTLL